MSGIRNGVRSSILLIALAIASASSPRAADYPDRSVKVIVPFPPGGATDIVGRIVMQKLSERLGQQFFIETLAIYREADSSYADTVRVFSLLTSRPGNAH